MTTLRIDRFRTAATLAAALLLATAPAWGAAPPSPAAKPATAKPAAAPAATRPKAADSAPPRVANAKLPTPKAASARGADTDSGYTLKSGDDGTVFRSLTVHGEDRIRLELERPELKLDLAPEKAPGLEWGTAGDVLDRTSPDLAGPLLRSSASQSSPWVARPWLVRFATGAVARFRPEFEGVERWKLTVADSRGESVVSFEGKGDPPAEIAWDGRSKNGTPVLPGLTYSYVFEAVDRAGNKRNFVGQGFQVSAYRLDGEDGPLLAFTGAELEAAAAEGRRATEAPPIVLEAATWLNQSTGGTRPVRITASARSFEQADRLGRRVVAALTPYFAGDPARLQAVAEVQPDAPAAGAVRIATAR